MTEWETCNGKQCKICEHSTFRACELVRAEAEAKLAALQKDRDYYYADGWKAHDRIAELEAEIKRLKAKMAYCQYNCATGRDSESYSLCTNCPAVMEYPGPPDPDDDGGDSGE